MTDRMLYLAFGVSIFGLVLITYVSPSIRPPFSRVSDIGSSSLEKAVRFEGNVSQVHVFKGGSVILSVSEGGSTVDVYMPSSDMKGLKPSMLVGRRVEVTGTVQVYRGKVEVVVDGASGVRFK